LVAIVILSPSLFALSLTGRNLLEYRAAEADKGNSFFENRLDIRLDHSSITLGLTYESMQPSRKSALTRADSTYSAITQRWAMLHHDLFDITGGTFMASLGNGLLLDATEVRDLQRDHHLDGAKVVFQAFDCDLKVLAGLADWDNNTRFMAGEISSNKQYFPIGAGYMRYDVEAWSMLPALIGETYEVHATPTVGPFDADIRYAQTWRGHSGGGVEYRGNVLSGSASAFVGPLTFYGEFLAVDSFIVKGYAEDYVTLPLVVRQPSYTLVSRHLALINPREATAFSGEIGISPVLDSDITASFAMIDHPEVSADYKEAYIDFHRNWGELSLKAAYQLQMAGEEDPTHNFIIEPLYYFTERKSLLLDLEFQSGVEFGEKATNLYGLAEFTLSPIGAIGVEGGRIQEWDLETNGLKPDNFIRIYIDGEIVKNHKLTLAYGKRPGGFTCSGGTCRMEPEFQGFELKLSSSF
jgi:hypothetical protein